jgi:hypothetical protein
MTRRALAKPAAPTETAASDEFTELSGLVGSVRPDWRDVWAYYERRSDVVARLRQLSRWTREAEARLDGKVER